MPLVPLNETLGKKRAAHLLRRTCMGASIDEIDTFATRTPAQAVAELFRTDLPDPQLPVDPLTGSEWITTGNAESEGFELERYLLAWHLGQLVGNDVAAPIKLAYIFRERLVFFFHTHFTTKKSIVNNSRAIFYQLALFRLFAFDHMPGGSDLSFKQLTKKVSVDNAMLVFLDGRFNVKGSPNENYARELLELYTVGRGLEGNVPEPEFVGDYFYFTEQDVSEGAKVLSGFDVDRNFANIDEETGLPRGVTRGGNIASSHETGPKTFSSRLGGGSVTADPNLELGGNPTEASVLDEISQFVDLIYEQPETTIHICRDLYRFFVYHQVEPSLQEDIIKDMANIFTANDFKLQPVIEALLTSTHFYEAAAGVEDNNFGSLIKSPLELVLGFMRNFEVTLPDYQTDLEAYYAYTLSLLDEIGIQGMNYYEPFEVAGYAAYHQFPIFNRSWITTNYLTNRYNFINKSIATGMQMEMGQVDVFSFVTANFDVATIRIVDDFIIAVASYFLPNADGLSFTNTGGELTVSRLNYFKTAMFAFDIDTDPEGTWTVRWDGGFDPETRANQIKELFNAMLQTPEYQLM